MTPGHVKGMANPQAESSFHSTAALLLKPSFPSFPFKGTDGFVCTYFMPGNVIKMRCIVYGSGMMKKKDVSVSN